MGLDGVEIVMEVEETFDITIADKDAEQLVTVGDLYQYILRKIDLNMNRDDGERPCLSALAFYRLRRTLMGTFGAERRHVRPSATTETLIGQEEGRRASWKRLARELGWRLPELQRPGWMPKALTVLLWATPPTVMTAWVSLQGVDQVTWKEALLLGCWTIPFLPLIALAAYRATLPYATCLPENCATVGGMAHQVVRRNFAIIHREAGGWSRPEEVWETLRDLLAGILGVSRELITPEANFLKDLGMD